jgi:hypothetical protein
LVTIVTTISLFRSGISQPVCTIFSFAHRELNQNSRSCAWCCDLPTSRFRRVIFSNESQALLLCPLIVLAPVAPRLARRAGENRAVPALLAAMVAFAVSCVIFIALVPFSSQRYAVDFMPTLLFVSCVGAAALLRRIQVATGHAFVATGVALALTYAIFANLGLAVQGPYDQFVQRDPRAYADLARKFSPIVSFRPLLDPTLRTSDTFNFPACPQRGEALLSAGETWISLSGLCPMRPGRLRLFSETALGFGSPLPVDVPFTPGPQKVAIEFTPTNRTMTPTGTTAPCYGMPYCFW